ncbi:MAG: long-chain fatty acid--CoA ligase [Acidobacteria bacterium]|nr:long-chain fatty acid--CoA ligase [Acidobacteriota bacterium]
MLLGTLNDIFVAIAERAQPRLMMHRQGIDWVAISSQEFCRSTCALARTLRSWSIAKSDRVAILSENRPEWAIADFASLLLGAVTVPVYCTLTAQQTAHILRDSGARVAFVSTNKQLAKLLTIREQTCVEKIVVMDALETVHAFDLQRLMKDGPAERDFLLERQACAVARDDLATIIYTSGTTGTPKGVMLTHGNLASNISCALSDFDVQAGDVMISFLPLSHVTARHVDISMLYRGVTLAYCPFLEQLPPALEEIKPTIFVAVPRVYEKIHAQVEQKTKSLARSAIYRWALWIGGRHRAETLAGRTPATLASRVADRLVYSQVRAGTGGRVRLYISGGAPLGRNLGEWYAKIGIRIHEGYGLTETSPVIAVNTPAAYKLGTVGKPLSNLAVRIADDGEILVRGPSVFREYWNHPDETQAAFTEGWFKTGDIGQLDGDGYLSITDRKKDLIKTSGGKFIAPQPIENSLKHNPLIAEAVIIGDRRKFPAVLLVPYFPMLEEWARKNQIAFCSRQDLVSNARVEALYHGLVANLNQTLARFEKLKKVIVVGDEFTAESGLLTPSMKLRRRVVEERYRDQIERLYNEVERQGARES